ncbi:membrane protein [Neptunitalea chrysea]|uniref:Membrane protein n=1 Tax=Neptunitalea chrysea TaxID=1647581 RepID=A0A9W6ET33_9FLAO|nr:OmpH family outer membrane protein [Neptunitalea chrysea]GLB51035.1 membrane protein [Neptunitalea chrysea]
MKSIKKLAVTVVLFIGFFMTANAQNKIAHINTQQLIQEMPEMQQANSELQSLEATYSEDIQASKKELQAKAKALEDKTKTLTNAEIEARRAEFEKEAQELQVMNANIEEASKNYMKILQTKQQEKLAPIYKKVQDAIKKVAADQGIDYVLDATQGGGLIVANGKDLLPDVKKELGI